MNAFQRPEGDKRPYRVYRYQGGEWVELTPLDRQVVEVRYGEAQTKARELRGAYLELEDKKHDEEAEWTEGDTQLQNANFYAWCYWRGRAEALKELLRGEDDWTALSA